jgi:hypothetical protein
MFGWFKSKEIVTVVPAEDPEISVLTVRNALVKMIWSDSPDSFYPNVIEFEWNRQGYKLASNGLLKNVYQAWARKKESEEVYFSAVLTIKGNQIIKVD